MDETRVMKIIHDQTGLLLDVNEDNSKCECSASPLHCPIWQTLQRDGFVA